MANNSFTGITDFLGEVDLNNSPLFNVGSGATGASFYETETLNTTISGDISPSAIDIGLRLTRIGNCITMSFDDTTPVTATGTGSLLVSADTLSANFRPLSNVYATLNVINESIYQTGLMVVLTSGTVVFYSATARIDFTGTTAVGICGASISWNI